MKNPPSPVNRGPARRLPSDNRCFHAGAVTTASPQPPDGILLGIECGGTRTLALACDRSGTLLTRIESGAANLRLVSDAVLLQRFSDLRDALPPVLAIGAGMAGVRGADDVQRVERLLERVWPGVPRAVDHDLQSALAAAELSGSDARSNPTSRRRPAPPEARVIVLSGTGSCCYGRSALGRTAKVGGWGHLLGDRCSGYDIAHSALRESVAEADRTGTWGRLGQRVLRQLQLNVPDDLIPWMQAAGKGGIAALAPEVFDAASAGDRVAKRVLTRLSESLADDAAACARRLIPRGGVVAFHLTGSVLLRQPGFAAAVGRQIRARWPKALVRPLERESVWGAVVMAREVWLALNAPGSPVAPRARSKPSRTSHSSTARPTIWIPRSTGLSPTEHRNPRSKGLDRMPLKQALKCLWNEEKRGIQTLLSDPGVHRGVLGLIRSVVRALGQGGRLIYVGAGTSGRLGVLDASECPPTFRTPPDWVQGIIAGGARALHAAVEGAEDDSVAGVESIRARGITQKDVVVGIAASGRTPFVWGALSAARAAGATTGLISFNPGLRFRDGWKPDHCILPDTGPEVITGSTRLKSGTATKLILNAVTTLAMVQLGKVMDNLMVDLNPSNAKLRDRAVRIVMELTGAHREVATRALQGGAGNSGLNPSVRRAVHQLRRRSGNRVNRGQPAGH